ncbi:hypothetical protein [Chromobacterium sp. Beijing]|uniref:hypothetical protein n=1 Tax=Chromobacterium sp. Beijing TaxID=2735795 RepID=UPI001F1B9BC5|nr:hypothetical protein [Chromobacterium sp. Beijing]
MRARHSLRLSAGHVNSGRKNPEAKQKPDSQASQAGLRPGLNLANIAKLNTSIITIADYGLPAAPNRHYN